MLKKEKWTRLDRTFAFLCDIVDTLRTRSVSARTAPHALKIFLALPARKVKVIVAISNMMLANPDGVPLKDLAARISLTVPATSVLVDEMVHDALLVRSDCPSDRRRICIRLTPDAEKRFFEDCEELSLEFENLFSDIPENDRRAFIDVTEKMFRILFASDGFFADEKKSRA